jgi:exodeoxyribonuclease VII large subunit
VFLFFGVTTLMNFFDIENLIDKKYTVSELTNEIKLLLETTLPEVWLEGEISNYKLHSSGHSYFSLKDQNAQIACVLWRGRNQGFHFTPQDGIKVIALGRVTVYEKRGNYQFDIIQMQPAGIGDLQLALEQLKKKLQQEGLFDQAHKKPLPSYPDRIGVVTSPTGAAIQDLMNIFNRRFPGIEIILNPVKVQGEGAAEEIARAIDDFNEYGEIDLMIVGRGGGSLEDLWAFNEEIVARAIYRSKIPVISAVGHEIDFSISDFVADLRAPTPSAAAELAVPDREQLLDKLFLMLKKAYNIVGNQISLNQERVRNLTNSYGFRRPGDLIRQHQQRLDELERTMERVQLHRQQLMTERCQSLTQKLKALSPQSILQRGYSICYRLQDNKIIKQANQLKEHDEVKIKFHTGEALGTIDQVNEK